MRRGMKLTLMETLNTPRRSYYPPLMTIDAYEKIHSILTLVCVDCVYDIWRF